MVEARVHGRLKGRRSITQAKRRNQKFIVAYMRTKSRFVDIIQMHTLMVPRADIQLRKTLGRKQFI